MSKPSNDAYLRQPLTGRKVLVTRAVRQAAALAEPLCKLGAELFVCPTIEIVPARDSSALDQALAELARIDILILSSPNAVEVFFSRLEASGLSYESLRSLTVVAVGPKTASLIRDHDLHVDLVPADYRAEGVVDLLRSKVAGKRVLYPKAELARDLLPRQLTEEGATVIDPVAYTSTVPQGAAEKLASAVRQGLDLLTFTASSTVRHLVELLDEDTLALVRKVPVASIGPLTSQTARDLGFKVVVEPQESTLEDFIAAIRRYYEETP